MRKERFVILEEKPEESIYSEDIREDLVESGEITPEEAGFMQGYDEAG